MLFHALVAGELDVPNADVVVCASSYPDFVDWQVPNAGLEHVVFELLYDFGGHVVFKEEEGSV